MMKPRQFEGVQPSRRINFQRPPGTIPYQDGPRYKGGFGVQSDSNALTVYKVCFDSANGYWVCACPAGIFRGDCKHLRRYSLQGRAKGVSVATPSFAPPPSYAAPLVLPPALAKAPVRRFAAEGEV